MKYTLMIGALSISFASIQCMQMQELTAGLLNTKPNEIEVEEGRGGLSMANSQGVSAKVLAAKLTRVKSKQDRGTVGSQHSGFECPEACGGEDWPLFVSVCLCAGGCVALFATLTSQGRTLGDYDFDWQNGPNPMTASHSSSFYNVSKSHMD